MLDAYRTPDRLRARIALHERFGDPHHDLHRWLFDLVLTRTPPPPPGAAVLEVGAGTGRLWRVNAERVPPGWRLTLTDRSAGMLTALRGTLEEAGLTAELLPADAAALPFPDASFDLAFANHMLYHLPDPSVGVAELRRVLRPGGLLVAATNGANHMRQVRELARPLGALEGVEPTGVADLPFDCENGGATLAARFAEVELHRHDDALEVTDPQALLAYLRSLVHLPEVVTPELEAALARWEAEVLAHATPGPTRVERATGVFLAR